MYLKCFMIFINKKFTFFLIVTTNYALVKKSLRFKTSLKSKRFNSENTKEVTVRRGGYHDLF